MGAKLRYNWTAVQADHKRGMTWRALINKYGMSMSSLFNAKRQGRFKSRTMSEATLLHISKHGARKHTEATKAKLSKAQLAYLSENPGKVPYVLYHSSTRSYPEMKFEQALIDAHIDGWVTQYRNGIYQYDFAFPSIQLDVEIDGNTHTQENVKKIDARRDCWSRDNGWQVLRFTAKQIKHNLPACIETLQKYMQRNTTALNSAVTAGCDQTPATHFS